MKIKIKQLIWVLIAVVSLSTVGCSSNRATMQDSLRSIASICMKTDVEDNDYSELHESLKNYSGIMTKDAQESVYMTLKYLKSNNILTISSQSAYSAAEYNDLGKNYWELDCIGVADGRQGRVVLQLTIDEKGKIDACVVKSQQSIKLDDK